MDSISKKLKWQTVKWAVLLACFVITLKTYAQPAIDIDPKAKAILTAMDNSTEEWNKGHLDAFMEMYYPTATMMMPTGPVGLDAIRSLYQTKYFNGGMPKQNLRYSDMDVRFLGKGYALLTGAFTLYGNNLPERSGRYSLVMINTKHGWKILHDHSG
jgi:ketosteroid isomerase-like protein